MIVAQCQISNFSATSYIRRDDDEDDQHTKLDFYSANILKQVRR